MATKKQIAEQAMRIISGGHLKPDRAMDIRELMLALDQLRDTLVKLNTFENVKQGDYVVEHDYLSFHNMTTQAAGANGLIFATLPVKPLALWGGLGVYQITPAADLEDAYIIVNAGQPGLLGGTDALNRTDKVYCWVVGDTVYFKNLAASLPITATLAATSQDIAEDADYPVSPDDESILLKQLLQLFGVQDEQDHDETEDGNK